jgi:hypothetical protein
MARHISAAAAHHAAPRELAAPPARRRASAGTSYGMLLARGILILLVLGALILGANVVLVPLLNRFVA